MYGGWRVYYTGTKIAWEEMQILDTWGCIEYFVDFVFNDNPTV